MMAVSPWYVFFELWYCHLIDTPSPLPIGDSAILLRAIGSQIRDQLALPWVPPLLRTPKLQHLQVSPPNLC